MSLSHRLQILLDEDRYARLAEAAEREHRSVAAVVRDALDKALGAPDEARRSAAALILSAEPMPVPEPAVLRAELDELRSRRA